MSCTEYVLFLLMYIFTLVHGIVSGLNQNDTTVTKVLFLDFSSAFNTFSDARYFLPVTESYGLLIGWQISYTRVDSDKSNVTVFFFFEKS